MDGRGLQRSVLVRCLLVGRLLVGRVVVQCLLVRRFLVGRFLVRRHLVGAELALTLDSEPAKAVCGPRLSERGPSSLDITLLVLWSTLPVVRESANTAAETHAGPNTPP